MNLALAVLAAIVLALLGPLERGAGLGPALVHLNLINFIAINIFLALFNLLPMPPFDGGHVVQGLLPQPLARHYARLQRFGFHAHLPAFDPADAVSPGEHRRARGGAAGARAHAPARRRLACRPRSSAVQARAPIIDPDWRPPCHDQVRSDRPCVAGRRARFRRYAVVPAEVRIPRGRGASSNGSPTASAASSSAATPADGIMPHPGALPRRPPPASGSSRRAAISTASAAWSSRAGAVRWPSSKPRRRRADATQSRFQSRRGATLAPWPSSISIMRR